MKFKEWILNETPRLVTNMFNTPEGIFLKVDGQRFGPVDDLQQQGSQVIAIVHNRPYAVDIGPIGARIIPAFQKLKANKPQAQAEKLDYRQLFGWPTDHLPLPPTGWKPAYMDMLPSYALRAAYNDGLPPGIAHTISEYVYNYSLKPANVEKRLMYNAGEQAQNTSSDAFDKLDPAELWRNVSKIRPLAAREHNRLMANNYRM